MGILDELVKNKNKDEYSLAGDSFWEYCKLKNPKFFKESRPHLKEIAEDLQAFYENRIIKFFPDDTDWVIISSEELESLPNEVKSKLSVCVKLMMNLPPRHGKSYILTLFTQWMLGKDNENRVITVSYNETLATRFSASVRDGIDETKIDITLLFFRTYFLQQRSSMVTVQNSFGHWKGSFLIILVLASVEQLLVSAAELE